MGHGDNFYEIAATSVPLQLMSPAKFGGEMFFPPEEISRRFHLDPRVFFLASARRFLKIAMSLDLDLGL